LTSKPLLADLVHTFKAIQLSRGERLGPIDRFNSTKFLCLSQART